MAGVAADQPFNASGTRKAARVLSARRIFTTMAGVGIVAMVAAGCATSATSAAQVGDVSISEADIFARSSAVVSQYESSSETTAGLAAVSTLRGTAQSPLWRMADPILRRTVASEGGTT